VAPFGRRLESEEGANGACLDSTDSVRPMAKSPFKFLQEVRSETDKVTWPTRRETAITTAMVFVMATLAAIFFLIGDQIIRLGVTTILGIGS
jgi:preprotein translocase subunit SecE